MNIRFLLLSIIGVLLMAALCAPPTTPDDSGGNQGGTTSAVSDDARAATLDQIGTMINGISTGDVDADNQTIAANLAAMPEVAQAEVYGNTVWARFQDNVAFVYLNEPSLSDTPLPEAQPPEDAPLFTNGIPNAKSINSSNAKVAPTRKVIPGAPTAKLFNAMKGNTYTDSTPVIKPWLEAAGYNTTIADGSVDGFATQINGDGLVYISSHGSPVPAWAAYLMSLSTYSGDAETPPPPNTLIGVDGKDHFILWTTTVATPENIIKYHDDVQKGLLVYAAGQVGKVTQSDGTKVIITENHLCMTDLFIRQNWRCAPGAFICVDACHSANSILRNVCLGSDVKADAFVGWTNTTFNDYSTPAVQFMFDRALGANEIPPVRVPKQRPFALKEVFSVMKQMIRSNGVPMDTSVGSKGFLEYLPPPKPPKDAKLVLYTNAAADNLLRPAISSLTFDERNEILHLNGEFSDTQGTVHVAGHDAVLTGIGWTAKAVECTLTPADVGEVYVDVGGLRSNSRWITAWDLTVRHHKLPFEPETCADCAWDMTWKFRIRDDVSSIRSEIEGGIVQRTDILTAPKDASFTLDKVNGAGKNYDQGDLRPFTMTEVPVFPEYDPIGGVLGAGSYFQAVSRLDMTARTHLIVLHIDAPGSLLTFDNGDTITFQITIFGSLYADNYPNNLLMPLDGSLNIAAGSKTDVDDTGSYFEWDSATVISPPPAELPN